MKTNKDSITKNMSVSYWAKPVTPRGQLFLCSPTLGDLIPEDDEIRLFDALMRELDWSEWENLYTSRRGQPPIHPRLIAGTLLFCLSRGLHSSRKIEEATTRRIDLMWFLEGRSVDHSTVCGFRKKFADLLPGLFDELARRATQGPEAGRQLAVDGTRVRANSNRHGSRTAASLRRRLAEIAQNSQALLEQMEQLDLLDDIAAATEEKDPKALRKQLDTLEAQREKLQRALEQADKRDALKKSLEGSGATPVRVPTTDPEAHLLPNKEGGYAPNYTPTIAVDVASGAIVDAQIADGAHEAGTLDEIVQATERRLGQKPEELLCDGSFPTGTVLQSLQTSGVEMCSPMAPPLAAAADRPDPTEPIAPQFLNDLPTKGRKDKKRFTRAAFLYNAKQDSYYCPAGRELPRVSKEKLKEKGGSTFSRCRYRSRSCSGCPLSERCLSGKAKTRTVSRDEYQPLRDALASRMETPENKNLYKKRAPTIEGAFGHLKHVLGMRRFLRRSLAAVQNEWLWICTAYNLGKILRRTLQNRPGGRRNVLIHVFLAHIAPQNPFTTLRAQILSAQVILLAKHEKILCA